VTLVPVGWESRHNQAATSRRRSRARSTRISRRS